MLSKILIEEKDKRNQSILQYAVFSVCILAVIIAVYSTLTFGQAIIHSDDAALVILAKLQLDTKEIFPANWNSSNGTVYILDLNSIMVALLPFVKNLSLLRQIASAIAILIAVVAIYLHDGMFGCETCFPSWALSIPIIFLFLNCTNNSRERDMTLYQAAYLPELVYIIVFCMLFYKSVKGCGKIYTLLVALLLFMLSATNIRWLAELVAPMFLFGCLKVFLEIRGKYLSEIKVNKLWHKYGRAAFLLLTPTVIGILLYRYISMIRNVNITDLNTMRFSYSLEVCLSNFDTMMRNIVSIFGYVGDISPFSFYGIRNIISFGICVIVIFLIPVLQVLKYREEDEYAQYFIGFGFMHNLIMIVMCIFFDKRIDRYLLSTVFVFILISVRYISKYYLYDKNKIEASLLVLLFLGITLLEGVIVLRQGEGWQGRLAEEKEFCEKIVDFDVKKGYATFLNANKNIIFSDYKLEIGSIEIVDGDIQAQYWLTDSNFFTDCVGGESFLLLHPEEKEELNEYMDLVLGKPTSCHMIEDMYLYIYDYDIGRKFY